MTTITNQRIYEDYYRKTENEKISICPDCNELESGNCFRHSLSSSSSTFVTANPKTGYWVFHSYPNCILCGEPSPNTVRLPYGSRYDGESICTDCIGKLIDPMLGTWVKK